MSTPAPRKFRAPTSREALRLVRESLGDDAVVLASRAVTDGVEVIAMAEGDTESLMAAAAPPAPVVAAAAAAAVVPAAGADAAPPAAAGAAPDAVLSELHSMRSMIEERLASVLWNDQQRRDPVRGRLLRTMLGAGFSARLSQAMLGQLPPGQSYAQGLAFVRAELARALPVQQDEDAMLAAGGVYALVGPTGVGKTTTTAKLAARCVMRFGPEQLALVTTDGYRIGAYEQLRIYGQILGVPVHAVKDSASLHAVLGELQDKHMVLIDTVGMSQRDRAVSDQIAMLCSAGRPVRRLLLLNAASHGDTLNEVVYAYQRAGHGNELAGCIFTKLDEAASRGALLDTVIRHRLPVHYVSNGQKVPEHLVAASGAQLVDDALRGPAPGALFVPDPDLLEHAAPDAAPPTGGPAAAAEAPSERRQEQYQRLIRAMAHDAGEVAAAARSLEQAEVGFAAAHALWASEPAAQPDADATLAQLQQAARAEALAGCDSHVLAVCGRVRLDADEFGHGFDLHGSVLLSDRHGEPFAAPNQWLTASRDAKSGARQLQWLRQQDFGRPLMHLLPRPPAGDELARWSAEGLAWLARAGGSTLVTDLGSAATAPLCCLEPAFGSAQPLVFKGRAALRAQAETTVARRRGGADQVLRCLVRRTTDAASGKVLEHLFLLSNAPAEIAADRLWQWQDWSERADACLRLAGKGLALLGGGIDEPGTPALTRRLAIAGQVATCAWRVQHRTGDRAGRTRVLLAELAGRRSDGPLSGNVMYEGLAKLFPLLDALQADAAEAARPGSPA